MKLRRNIEKELAKFKAGILYRLLKENGRDHIWRFAIAFVLLACVGAVTGLTAYLMEDVINEIFVERRAEALYWISAAVALLFLIKGACAYASSMIMSFIGNDIVARVQRQLYDKMINTSMSGMSSYTHGVLTMRFTHNANAARNALNLVVVNFWQNVFMLIALVSVMVIQDPYLSLAFFIAGPPIIMCVNAIVRAIKAIVRNEFAAMARIPGIVKETFVGVKPIKTFQLEGRFRGEMNEAITGVRSRMNELARLSNMTVPLMEAFAGVSIALVVLFGGWQVIANDKEPGAFFSFITALLLAYDPARRLARFQVDFQHAMIGVGMLYEFLDDGELERDPQGAKPLVASSAQIEFVDVSFSYGKAEALRGVDLVVPSQSVTALVGPSGAGKSTLFSLVTKLYEPSGGRLLVDGVDTRGVTTASLRDLISVVSQDNWLFEGTVRENIALGDADADEARIAWACEQACVTEFLPELPNGLDTDVGEGGRNLSGGQRQRVSIARALLRERPILLLDEATSSLDSLTEAKVQAAIDKLMIGRTTLVIAHRLSTVLHAQQIAVMDQGRVIATGSHDALIANNTLYRAIYETQFAHATQTAATGT